jgi:D-alanyl-lipoteichoic acid acyltransferase DltB (MBOAT superfamily)
MLFHTYIFAIFFAITYSVYMVVKSTRYSHYWLLLTSYVFYGWWNPLYLLLLLYSTTLDYFSVHAMARSQRKKLWLTVTILNNLSLLFFFKYAGFVVDNLNAVAEFMGLSPIFDHPDILLPVGITFFTFQSMSYAIDFYRGEVQAERSFVRFAAFVALFPQLMAGPIQRASHLLPQMQSERQVTWAHFTEGVTLFVVGLFKKVAIADMLAIFTDSVYSTPENHGGGALLLATYSFAWQIYADFSGYSDMARGIARMMGYNFMVNFNHPYVSTNLGEFWRRWHISLSTWFRDYVFIPLGGSRNGMSATYRNIFITMTVSGLWHGATWNFVIWGVINALGRILMMPVEATDFYKKLPKIVKQLWIFHFICLTWVFFRATKTPGVSAFTNAITIIQRIATDTFSNPQFPLIGIAAMLGLWAYQLMAESKWKSALANRPVRIATVSMMLMYMFILCRSSGGKFIYFDF